MEGDELGMKVCFVLERFSLPFFLRGGFADASLAGALKGMYPGEGLPSKAFRIRGRVFPLRPFGLLNHCFAVVRWHFLYAAITAYCRCALPCL